MDHKPGSKFCFDLGKGYINLKAGLGLGTETLKCLGKFNY